MVDSKSGHNTASDTSELIQRLEKEIELSQEKTRLILSAIPVGLIMLQKDGTIDVVNRLVRDMFEYSRSDLFGKPVTLLIPDLHLEKIVGTAERWAHKSNGEKFPVQVSTVSAPTPDGERLFLFVSDISERHRLEKLKQEFIAMLSHDLRTPLMNISGIIELASAGRFGELSSDGIEQLQIADRSLDRVIQMISEMLQIEKLKEGHLVLNVRVNNLTTCVDAAIDDVERLAENKGIALSAWEENAFATFDNDSIHRVLVNLLSNAIKFSPENSTIKIEYQIAKGFIEVRVIDTGRGVPEELQEKIFDKFEQVSRRDATERGGIGLGLAAGKAIVEAHGGSIGVRNNDIAGSGSIFWFKLPFVDD